MKTDINLSNLINEIREVAFKENSNFWRRIAKELEKSTRRQREVNIEKINKYTKDKEIVIVPGKVLGNGELDHDVTIAALKFTEPAKKKLKNTLTIKELLKKEPKGKNIRIIG
ncbi:MAG: 50S ribosomal protein L18e [Candidatus Woesearchaeota archaeon]